MAVGKSAVGKLLARRLGRPFVDLDEVIEKKEGMTVREIFSRKGEAYFRRLEKETVKEVLERDGLVVATGGGAVLDDENLRLLKERSFLVCLTASLETVFERAGMGSERPLLQGESRWKRIEQLLKQREARYAQAHITIDTDGLSVDEVADLILEALKSHADA